MINDDIRLTILMMTIIPAQIHNHEGIDSIGSNLMAQQVTNDKSVDSNIDFPRIGFEKGTTERGFSKVSKSV